MNLKFFIQYCLLIFLSNYAYCQAPIISDTIKVKGIYLSFEEFKQNNPSIRCEIKAVESKVPYDFMKKYFNYSMSIEDSITINRKKVWGFCDGSNVYRAEVGEFSGKSTRVFNKIEYIGRFCYYQEINPGNAPFTNGGGPNGMKMNPGTPNSLISKVINMNNGSDYELYKESLLLIIKKDSELYAEYKADKNKKENYLHYIKKYCEKHPEELK